MSVSSGFRSGARPELNFFLIRSPEENTVYALRRVYRMVYSTPAYTHASNYLKGRIEGKFFRTGILSVSRSLWIFLLSLFYIILDNCEFFCLVFPEPLCYSIVFSKWFMTLHREGMDLKAQNVT